MILTCPQCQSQYNIDAGKIGAEGKTVRCANCQHKWFQAAEVLPSLTQESENYNKILSDMEAQPAVAEPAPDLSQPSAMSEAPAPVITHDPFGLNARAFGAMIFCLCLFTTLTFLFLAQKPLVRHWPQMSLFYKTLGFHIAVPGEGLRLSEIVAEQRIDKQDVMLMIEGKITNMGELEMAYPPLYVTLKNKQGEMIKDWKIDPGVVSLASGESVPVMLQLTGAPPDGKTVDVRVQGE